MRFGPLETSSDAATHAGSSIGHLSSSSSIKGVTRAIPLLSSADELEGKIEGEISSSKIETGASNVQV